MQGVPGVGDQATIVITDIKGSTRLWSACPAAMTVDIKRHDNLLRDSMLLYNGVEVATEGDSFMVPPPVPTPLSLMSLCGVVLRNTSGMCTACLACWRCSPQ